MNLMVRGVRAISLAMEGQCTLDLLSGCVQRIDEIRMSRNVGREEAGLHRHEYHG